LRAHSKAGEESPDPRPPAVTFVTTEHFVLQGSRAATIAESTGRANMFLASVSGGLVALGLVATASRVGTAFYAVGLVLLPTLAFVGLVTFERVLQSGIEDKGYARRIAVLRGYYFDNAPELAPYLLSVPPEERLRVQGLGGGPWQDFRTVAGMVAVIHSRACRLDHRAGRDPGIRPFAGRRAHLRRADRPFCAGCPDSLRTVHLEAS
jgi:hypothetical protein